MALLSDEFTGCVRAACLDPEAEAGSDEERADYFRVLEDFLNYIRSMPGVAQVSTVRSSGYTHRCKVAADFLQRVPGVSFATDHLRAVVWVAGKPYSIRKLFAEWCERIRRSVAVFDFDYRAVLQYIAHCWNTLATPTGLSPTAKLTGCVDDRKRVPFGATLQDGKGRLRRFAGYDGARMGYIVRDDHGCPERLMETDGGSRRQGTLIPFQ